MATELSELITQDILDARDLQERFDELTEDHEHLESCVEELQDAVDEVQSRVDDLDRDLYTTVDAYEEAKEQHEATLKEAEEDLESAKRDLAEWEKENLDELNKLDEAISDIGSYTCRYGETLVAESYFTEYAKELADDIGAIPNTNWPLNCIDWDQAARELRYDYSEVTIDGQTFLYRT